MPRLCDITKPNVPCELYFIEDRNRYQWDGVTVRYNGTQQTLSNATLHDDRWHVYTEPTVKEVIEAAGYGHWPDFSVVGFEFGTNEIYCAPNTPIDKVKKIIAFAEEMKK